MFNFSFHIHSHLLPLPLLWISHLIVQIQNLPYSKKWQSWKDNCLILSHFFHDTQYQSHLSYWRIHAPCNLSFILRADKSPGLLGYWFDTTSVILTPLGRSWSVVCNLLKWSQLFRNINHRFSYCGFTKEISKQIRAECWFCKVDNWNV